MMVETNKQGRCVRALTAWIPEMEIEDPPVSLTGPLAEAVMECLKVEEPEIEELLYSRNDTTGQWGKLWRRFAHGLLLSAESSVATDVWQAIIKLTTDI